MMSYFSSSGLVKQRLLEHFVVLAVVPLLVAGPILAWHSRTVHLENVSLAQHARAKCIATEFAVILNGIEQKMEAVQWSRDFTSLDPSAQDRILAELVAARDVFEDVLVLDAAGKVASCVSNTSFDCRETETKGLEGYGLYGRLTGTAQTSFGPVRFDAETGVPRMPVVMPLVDHRTGGVKGALVADVRLKRIWNYIGGLSFSKGEDVFILDSRNRVIAHRNPTVVLQGTFYTPVAEAEVQPGLSGKQAVVAVEEVTIGGQEFRVVVEQAADRALAVFYHSVVLLVVLLLAALLGSLALAGLTNKKIFAPLNELREVAGEFIKGNYSPRLLMPEGREFEELARTFNRMADSLERTLNNLDLEVKVRRNAEEALRKSEERFRDLTENTSDWIWEFDKNESFTYASPKVRDLLGYEPGEVIGKSIFSFTAAEEIAAAREEFAVLMERHLPFSSHERVNRHKNGTPLVLESSGIPIFGVDGEFRGYRGIARDITERHEAEVKLQASLEEKEVLLKEIHHRVKNNLQIISSLLFLQIDKTESPEARAVLTESQSRLKSMALIHEKLYQTGDLARIDFAGYLKSLVSGIYHTYTGATLQVEFTVEADPLRLPVNLAIPCGLIVNELVTNSLKHAFSEGQTGTVLVSFAVDKNGRCSLSVKDNGCGLPGQVDAVRAQSLGMALIENLTGQLNGTVEFRSDNGTECRVTFQT